MKITFCKFPDLDKVTLECIHDNCDLCKIKSHLLKIFWTNTLKADCINKINFHEQEIIFPM